MIKKITFLLLIFVIIFTLSCNSDDDDNDIETPEIGYKLVKIETYRMPNDELKETTVFEYNEDGFVSKTERTHYNSGLNTINYIYTNGKITGVDHVYNNSSENHTYTDGLITSSAFNNFISLNENYNYTYNSDNQLIKSLSSNQNSTYESEITYTYDNNNNVLSENFVTYSNYSTYDSKKNPYSLVYPEAFLKIRFIGQNNVLTDDYGNIYSYEYNDNGYPSRLNNYYIGQFITYSLYTYEDI